MRPIYPEVKDCHFGGSPTPYGMTVRDRCLPRVQRGAGTRRVAGAWAGRRRVRRLLGCQGRVPSVPGVLFLRPRQAARWIGASQMSIEVSIALRNVILPSVDELHDVTHAAGCASARRLVVDQFSGRLVDRSVANRSGA